jgi:hypothetical protein
MPHQPVTGHGQGTATFRPPARLPAGAVPVDGLFLLNESDI